MSYTQKVLDELKARYPEQPEFIQAATEILGTNLCRCWNHCIAYWVSRTIVV